MEALAETDDAIMELYLGEEDIPAKDLKAAIRKACCGLKLVPVFAGSALRNKGVQPVLDAVVDFLPSPLDVPPIEGVVTRPPVRPSAARPTTVRHCPPWPSRYR